MGADLTDLFNTLTGYSRQTNYWTLMVAPHGIRTGLIEKIRRETRHAAEGRPAHLCVIDPEVTWTVEAGAFATA